MRGLKMRGLNAIEYFVLFQGTGIQENKMRLEVIISTTISTNGR